MSGFDAVAHAMTAIATGGFSTYDASIAHFDNAGIDWAISLTMLLGWLPFVLYLRVARGSLRTVFAYSPVTWLLSILPISVSLVPPWFSRNPSIAPPAGLPHRPTHTPP